MSLRAALPHSASSPERPAPAAVVVTSDDRLGAEVQRLAAAAGAVVELVGAVPAALRRWGTPSAMLVGADAAVELARSTPPRRGRVHVLAHGAVPDGLFRAALELGATSVVAIPQDASRLMQLLSDLAEERDGEGVLIAVTGGSGGVGASVLAAALGRVAAARGPAALVDLDPSGPGLRWLAGFDDADAEAALTWRELAEAPGRLGAKAFREALPHHDGLGVLDSGGTAPQAELLREVVAAACRGHDVVVLDVPRPVPEPLMPELTRCDRVLLLVRAALPQVLAAARAAARLTEEGVDVGVVVRCRRRDPGRAADVARAVGAPLLAELPDQRRLDEHLGLGVGPVVSRRGPLARVAHELLAEWSR